jgi:hypothetical protein
MKHFNTPLRKIAGSLLVGAFLTGSAYADVQVREVSLGNGYHTTSLQLPVASSAQNYWSGFQNIEVTNGSSTSSFSAFCVDPFQYSSGGFTTYTIGDFASFFGARTGAITQLYNNAYAGTLGNTDAHKKNAAAFQLALWELANDDGYLATGGVHKTDSTVSWLQPAAQTLLDGIGQQASASSYNFTFYRSEGKQDFLVATPVPEPGTYAMFLAGLGLMGVIARRRSAS